MNRFQDFLQYVTKKNTATALILFMVATAMYSVLVGNITLSEAVALLDLPVTGLVIGAGLTGIAFTKARGVEEILGIAVVLILVYAVVGMIQVFTSDLTIEAYLKLLDLPAFGMAIGKGAAANNSTRA